VQILLQGESKNASDPDSAEAKTDRPLTLADLARA
jgi:hypothetical protein